jgi:DNA-binding response OmpR family regulator
MRILIVDDNAKLATLLSDFLGSRGYTVDSVASIEDAFTVPTNDYDAVLLDRRLPDGDGLDWLRRKRSEGWDVPTIMFSATALGVHDRIEGLAAGADDYMAKPVHHDELLARLKAMLRRPRSITPQYKQLANLTFDLDAQIASVDGKILSLARREAQILGTLVRRAGRVVSRASLEQNIYSLEQDVSANAVEVAIHRLRTQLERAGARVKVHTLRGIGYMLQADDG